MPGFQTGTTPWVFYTNGAGSFDNTPAGSGSPRAGHISIATEGSNVQLYQPGVTLEANTVYTLSFKARSSSGNDVTINVQQHGAPYASYGLSKEFNLTTAGATHRCRVHHPELLRDRERRTFHVLARSL